ncbi:hypothetical protein OPT61_g1981 [Boeremia exigua]|uniref:Uncharacterized protein n=1 Tax=Boeremia exigua TaxID=749465 RepID=A0ACC2INE2_9PLEO|nr:hypothetical protein OPT61_g1981 [Boeremia exigua]
MTTILKREDLPIYVRDKATQVKTNLHLKEIAHLIRTSGSPSIVPNLCVPQLAQGSHHKFNHKLHYKLQADAAYLPKDSAADSSIVASTERDGNTTSSRSYNTMSPSASLVHPLHDQRRQQPLLPTPTNSPRTTASSEPADPPSHNATLSVSAPTSDKDEAIYCVICGNALGAYDVLSARCCRRRAHNRCVEALIPLPSQKVLSSKKNVGSGSGSTFCGGAVKWCLVCAEKRRDVYVERALKMRDEKQMKQ